MGLTSSPSSAVCVRGAKKEKGSKVPWSSDAVCVRRAKKGSKVPWSSDEDEILRDLVKKHGPRSWSLICRGIPGRSAKSCRLRWCNHLLPGLNFRPFTPEEDSKIIALYRKYKSRWATMAQYLPGRSDNAIKNRWNCTLKNRHRCEPLTGGDDGFMLKVAESCEPSKPQLNTLQRETIEPAETCNRDIVSQKPLLELNLLTLDFLHREKQAFDTQRDFSRFTIDHGIDDPMTTLTLGFAGMTTTTETCSSDSSSEEDQMESYCSDFSGGRIGFLTEY